MSVSAIDACRMLSATRGDSIVVATMSALNAMDAPDNRHPLTIACVPLMGGSGAIALGVALARPDRRVVVLDGDSSLLMELGVLATIAGAAPANYVHIVFANGVQFGGHANTPLPGGGRVDFVAMAKGAGFAQARLAATLPELEEALREASEAAGPVLIELSVQPPPARLSAGHPQPEIGGERFTRLGDDGRRVRAALGAVPTAA